MHVGPGLWEKVWEITDYDQDPVASATTFGGDLASFDGYLYWGTMHIPMLSAMAFFRFYATPSEPEGALAAVLGTHRPISIFRGRNFGTVDEDIELLYGMPLLPTYYPVSG